MLAHRKIRDDYAGLQELLEMLGEHGDGPDEPVPVPIEARHGLLVAALRATRPVAAKKSDRADAVMLAGVLRTDRHQHGPLSDDSEQVQALAVLARA